MQEKALSPAEIGTAMHMVMQHMPFSEQIDHETIEILLQEHGWERTPYSRAKRSD